MILSKIVKSEQSVTKYIARLNQWHFWNYHSSEPEVVINVQLHERLRRVKHRTSRCKFLAVPYAYYMYDKNYNNRLTYACRPRTDFLLENVRREMVLSAN